MLEATVHSYSECFHPQDKESHRKDSLAATTIICNPTEEHDFTK